MEIKIFSMPEAIDLKTTIRSKTEFSGATQSEDKVP
jgi:hypothetical protein